MSTYTDTPTEELLAIEARLQRSYRFAQGNLGTKEQYRIFDRLTQVSAELSNRVAEEEGYWDEGPTCSLCDGLGHGYPGAGPCPLEERGRDEGPGHAWER